METVLTPNGSLDDAMSYLQAGKADDALAILRGLVQQTPSDWNAHALIGVCHAQQNNLDGAIKSLETAALLNPENPAIQYNLANVLFQCGRKDQAIWRLTRILEDDPGHQDAQALLTHIQRQSAPPPAPAQPTGVQRPGTQVSASRPGVARQAGVVPQAQTSAPVAEGAPRMGLRVLRGLGWGLLYSQSWTVCSLFGALALSLFTTKVEHAVLAFLLLCGLSAMFHSAMGLLIGTVVALMNAEEDAGGWVGACVGFLILLIGVRFGFIAMWAVVFYIFIGWAIGKAVAFRVQRPVPA